MICPLQNDRQLQSVYIHFSEQLKCIFVVFFLLVQKGFDLICMTSFHYQLKSSLS